MSSSVPARLPTRLMEQGTHLQEFVGCARANALEGKEIARVDTPARKGDRLIAMAAGAWTARSTHAMVARSGEAAEPDAPTEKQRFRFDQFCFRSRFGGALWPNPTGNVPSKEVGAFAPLSPFVHTM